MTNEADAPPATPAIAAVRSAIGSTAGVAPLPFLPFFAFGAGVASGAGTAGDVTTYDTPSAVLPDVRPTRPGAVDGVNVHTCPRCDLTGCGVLPTPTFPWTDWAKRRTAARATSSAAPGMYTRIVPSVDSTCVGVRVVLVVLAMMALPAAPTRRTPLVRLGEAVPSATVAATDAACQVGGRDHPKE